MNADIWRNVALLILLAGFTLWLVRRRESPRVRIAARLREVVAIGTEQLDEPLDEAKRMPQRLMHRIAALGEKIPVVQGADRTKLAAQLASAGYRDLRAVSLVSGLKIVTGAALALGSIAVSAKLPVIGQVFVFRVLIMAAAFMIGMMLPEIVLDYLVRKRRKAIALALPDALDLLVICTNAGNSLVVAIRRVATELGTICPPLSEEFIATADELSIGGDVSHALTAMSARIGTPTMSALVSTLVQSQKYGTPITQALRTLSRTERTMQIVALEEKAAKLAPKMTLPMIVFIVPTILLIAVGPAMIELLAAFRAL